MELPNHLGKFISGLNLQPEFLRLGVMIHNFEDGHRVLVALNTLIVHRFEENPSTENKANISRLFQVCTEISRIKAVVTI